MDNVSTPAGGHPDGVFTASAGQGGHGVRGGIPVFDRTAPSGVPALGVHTTLGQHIVPASGVHTTLGQHIVPALVVHTTVGQHSTPSDESVEHENSKSSNKVDDNTYTPLTEEDLRTIHETFGEQCCSDAHIDVEYGHLLLVEYHKYQDKLTAQRKQEKEEKLKRVKAQMDNLKQQAENEHQEKIKEQERLDNERKEAERKKIEEEEMKKQLQKEREEAYFKKIEDKLRQVYLKQ